ncbi:MAG TPA: prephenate dehydrogenase/arogenate dehydrogenase family protein, partial [Burkholderiaceae bacterium]|nr:prephenate dehydrogenase/arogenate dehydrogenase family protein [Burkholderiaceae bacterium]
HAPDAQLAATLGLIDRVAATLADAVRDADLVVLAAPVEANVAFLRALPPLLAPAAIVTDVSSTKRSIIGAAAALGAARPRFVPGHPIAGSEHSGPRAARADLFDGCACLLSPTAQTGPQAFERVAQLWRALGARVFEIDAQRHDALFAAVSHWPHAVAFALSAAVGGGELADDARRFAGAGLRDTTRVGASSPELWAGILLDNRDAVLAASREFERQVSAIADAIEAGDRAALTALLAAGARWRRTL